MFFGRFHPLAVHLPIGFLVMAIVLEVLVRRFGYESYRPALRIAWLLGAGGALLAAALGFLLAAGGGYQGEVLEGHRWGGVLLVCLSALIFIIQGRMRAYPAPWTRYGYPLLVAAVAVLLVFTGHRGGTLTHGEGFLVEYAPEPIRRLAGGADETLHTRVITSLDSADVFADAVMPIFRAKCASCHNSTKRKGKLLVSSYDEILKGGETAAGITPGNVATSEIFRRITLPEDHEDFMPGEGKRPLTAGQVAIIEWWIEHDAPRSGTVSSFSPGPEAVTMFESFFGMHERERVAPPADEQLLASLRASGLAVNRLSRNSNLLEVRSARQAVLPETMRALAGLKEQLIWLDLSRSGIRDEDLEALGELPYLERLNLHGNPITGKGLYYLAGLSRLQYLNLFDTQVSDSSLQAFAAMPNLKRLYLWKTDISGQHVIDSLKTRNPALRVVYELPAGPGVPLDSAAAH